MKVILPVLKSVVGTLNEIQRWLLDLNLEELAFVRFMLSGCLSGGPDPSNISLYVWP